MSNAITVLRSELGAMRSQIEMVLPKHVPIDRFVRVAMTAIQTNPQLLDADRRSVMAACLEAATDGLVPDGREGAIVPYRVKGALKAQWQPMVWGLVALVRRSGELRDIGAMTVHAADEFSHWVDEDGPHFKHVPKLSGRGEPIAVYAYARTADGGSYLEVMGWDEIEKFRSKSKATGEGTPWAEWPTQMAQARAIKRLCKRLPMQADIVDALRRDDEREGALLQGTPKADPIADINRAAAGLDDNGLNTLDAEAPAGTTSDGGSDGS